MVKQQKKQMWWSFTVSAVIEEDIELIEWLEAEKTTSRTEKVMEAIRRFWKAIAAMENRQNSETVRRLGLTCCHDLEQQSNYLRVVFFLPPKGMEKNHSLSQIDWLKKKNWSRSITKEKSWTFIYQPFKSSPDFELVSWLKTTVGAKRKIMQALSAYWLAIAVRERNTLAPEQLKMLALNCCNMLESHSDYIKAVLDLPPRVVYVDRRSPLEGNPNSAGTVVQPQPEHLVQSFDNSEGDRKLSDNRNRVIEEINKIVDLDNFNFT